MDSSATGGKKLLSEELAERGRAALTTRPPAHLSAGDAERRRRTRSRASAAERRRYMVHGGKAEEQAAALESRYPWTGAMSLALGFSVALFGGSLAPAGLAVAALAAGLGITGVIQGIRYYGARAHPVSGAGIALAALFCAFHLGADSIGFDLDAFLRQRLNTAASTPLTSEQALRRVHKDFGRLNEALTNYYFSEFETPLPPASTGNMGANRECPPASPDSAQPSFRVHVLSNESFHALTTPVAFLPVYPRDPFAPAPEATYGYFPSDSPKDVALLLSPGPDRVYQIQPGQDFHPGQAASRDLLLWNRWDPTNGSLSAGDLWYVYKAPAQKPQSPFFFTPAPAPAPLPKFQRL